MSMSRFVQSRHSAVNIQCCHIGRESVATSLAQSVLRAEPLRNKGSILYRDRRFFSCTKRPDRFWSLFSEYQVYFPGSRNGWDLKLTIHLPIFYLFIHYLQLGRRPVAGVVRHPVAEVVRHPVARVVSVGFTIEWICTSYLPPSPFMSCTFTFTDLSALNSFFLRKLAVAQRVKKRQFLLHIPAFVSVHKSPPRVSDHTSHTSTLVFSHARVHPVIPVCLFLSGFFKLQTKNW